MKRRITHLSIAFLLFLTGFSVRAQTNSKVTGQVLDKNKKPFEKATVTLLRSKDSALVKIDFSNASGYYEFEYVKPGSYLISVSAVGFGKKFSPVFSAAGDTINVPVLEIQEVQKNLGEVVVSANKPMIEQKIDRTVVNVDASPTNAGATALEVLEKSPGVTVSNEGAISLKGKQGVIVMMDGKPTFLSQADLANLLRNMPASALDQIEIMTNPSAKYDAAGNSGIINIKTKKSRYEGFNGSFTIGNTLGIYDRRGDLIFPYRNNASINMNYRKAKINLFGNYNFNYRQGKSDLELTRNFFDKTGGLSNTSDQTTTFNQLNHNHTLKMGIDYFANKKNVFGFVVSGFGFFGKPLALSTQAIKDPSGNAETFLNSTTDNKLRFHNITANFNYKHTFDSTGREITVDLDYVRYGNDSKSLLVTDIFDGTGAPEGNLTLRNEQPGAINIYSFKADYTHPLKKKTKLETGIKSSIVRNDNEVIYDRQENGGWVPDSRSNHFIYSENINAAYINLSKQFNKKWSAQTGLRLENTVARGNQVTTDTTFRRNYTNLFPTAYVNYAASEKHNFTISYGRRIERPNYQDLNPFTWFLDSLTFRQGNPYLLPQFSHNIEFRHSYKNAFTTSLNYTVTNDVISQLLKQDTENKITFLTVDNVARFRNIGISITTPVLVAKWWKMNIFTNVYNNKFKGVYYNSFTGNNDPIDISFTAFMVNISNTFTFPKGWTGEISGWYRSKAVEQLSIANPMYFMNLGGQKNIMKGKATLRLNIRDPFHWQRYSGYTQYSDIDVRIKNRWDNRNVTFTFTYRFGKNTIAPSRRRNTGVSEEQNRAGGGQNQ
ncbi:MAG: TonB-dependent receptor [Chitinophagaceae bacterium]|nr:TonB-dependent receptor [Chitinophagaceae bacterium]